MSVRVICISCEQKIVLDQTIVNKNFTRNNGHLILKNNANPDLSCPHCHHYFTDMTKTCFEVIEA